MKMQNKTAAKQNKQTKIHGKALPASSPYPSVGLPTQPLLNTLI